MSDPAPPVTRAGAGFALGLSPAERDLIRALCGELRTLLVHDDVTDPALARLFPAAYPDDPLRNLDFEREAGAGLRSDRLAAVDVVETTAGADTLSEEELLAWLGSVNALRLALGTRLGVTEETTEAAFPEGHPERGAYATYGYLTWLEGEIVDALSEP